MDKPKKQCLQLYILTRRHNKQNKPAAEDKRRRRMEIEDCATDRRGRSRRDDHVDVLA